MLRLLLQQKPKWKGSVLLALLFSSHSIPAVEKSESVESGVNIIDILGFAPPYASYPEIHPITNETVPIFDYLNKKLGSMS